MIIDSVPWTAYAAFTDALGDRGGVRFAYDGGAFEIVAPSPECEAINRLIEALVGDISLVCDVPLEMYGSTTFRIGEELGVEPDSSYYIEHANAMRGRRRIDLASDPPPDLVLEIDLSGVRLDKRAIYAAMGVPEVWRHDGKSLTCFVLEKKGYVETAHSRAFPWLVVRDINRFVERASAEGRLETRRAWQSWIGEIYRERSR